jgi:hypothetical protein
MSFVFVSYFRENKAGIARLLERLRAEKIPYWIDEEGMEGGELWRAKIARKIDEATAFLFCFSKVYYERPDSYVRQELEIAQAKTARMHTSVAWIVPVGLDSAPIPEIRVGANGKLSDLHVIMLDGRGMDECVRRLSDLIANPALNMASIRLSSASLIFPTFIEVNDQLLTTSGEFISVRRYEEEYEKLHPPDIGPDAILDVFVLKRDSTREFFVMPGQCKLRAVHMTFSQGVGQWGPIGDPSWVTFASNTLQLQVGAKERKSLLVRTTPRTGFLWRNKPTTMSYYLTEI